MTAKEYITQRLQDGGSLTRAVKEISAICSVGERSVWEWHQGRVVPPYAAKLLRIWADCSPAQRERWFNQ